MRLGNTSRSHNTPYIHFIHINPWWPHHIKYFSHWDIQKYNFLWIFFYGLHLCSHLSILSIITYPHFHKHVHDHWITPNFKKEIWWLWLSHLATLQKKSPFEVQLINITHMKSMYSSVYIKPSQFNWTPCLPAFTQVLPLRTHTVIY